MDLDASNKIGQTPLIKALLLCFAALPALGCTFVCLKRRPRRPTLSVSGPCLESFQGLSQQHAAEKVKMLLAAKCNPNGKRAP